VKHAQEAELRQLELAQMPTKHNTCNEAGVVTMKD
jgi:hypothetical protein